MKKHGNPREIMRETALSRAPILPQRTGQMHKRCKMSYCKVVPFMSYWLRWAKRVLALAGPSVETVPVRPENWQYRDHRGQGCRYSGDVTEWLGNKVCHGEDRSVLCQGRSSGFGSQQTVRATPWELSVMHISSAEEAACLRTVEAGFRGDCHVVPTTNLHVRRNPARINKY